jgi:hypothetical protein
VDLIVLGQRGLGPHEGLLGGVARKIVNMTQISCLIATWSSVGGTSMNSRERMRLALNHREPDRVPFDLGGTGLSTIHVTAHRNLRQHLGLPEVQPGVAFVPEQLVRVDADLAERLQADVCPVLPGTSSTFEYVFRDRASTKPTPTNGALDGGCQRRVVSTGATSRRWLPGGGFVFAAVHDIRANVPPENIVAMWEAWRE